MFRNNRVESGPDLGRMKVIIAGGGTGGHLFPGIAVAREIQRRQPASRILFVGAEQGIETSIVPKEGFELRTLPIGGIKGLGVARQVRNLVGMVSGFFKAQEYSAAVQARCCHRRGRICVVSNVERCDARRVSARDHGAECHSGPRQPGHRQMDGLCRRYRRADAVLFWHARRRYRQPGPARVQVHPAETSHAAVHDSDFRRKSGRAVHQSRDSRSAR